MDLKRSFIVGVVVLLVVFQGAATAATTNDYDDTTNWQSDNAPAPRVLEGNLTLVEHEIGTDPLKYEDDGGDVRTLNASINHSARTNEFTFYASNVDAARLGEFPRKTDESDNDASILDDSEYTTTGTNASALTVSAGQTTRGNQGVLLDTDGTMEAGSDAAANYTNFTVSTDVNKRVVTVVGNVRSAESGATLNVTVGDGDGDVKTFTVAKSVGDGFVTQAKLADLAVGGTGDGTLDDVEWLHFNVTGGDMAVLVTGADAEKKNPVEFGTYENESSGDTTAVESVSPGTKVNITSLSSLSNDLEGATVYGLTFPGDYTPANAATHTKYTKSDKYPGYWGTAEWYVEYEIPSVLDLEHADLTFIDTQSLPASYYMDVGYAEGVSDGTHFTNASYASIGGQYDEEGKSITVDSTVQTGVRMIWHGKAKITDDVHSDLTASGGSSMDGRKGGGGGLFDTIQEKVMWLLGSLASLLGISALMGGGGATNAG